MCMTFTSHPGGKSMRSSRSPACSWVGMMTNLPPAVFGVDLSRSDWLRELDDPAKAEAWWPYCNRFWITAPPGIIVPAELPEGWGLMELPSNGRRFKVKVAAGSKVPKLTTALMVELLRRADNARL